ncbi:plasmid stabilization protein [Chania multitudinisentens RB-25]|uniref:Plasmid stabilization protein n=1 Tax=Chania multitudinisentens RB-25 TaxID=1441930 RepID=W0LE39_9GAMM|nr:plasmid segregation protein ParM domain-containing protein [Chania multitudinisentens]AHG20654.1 plasmid stabilization protein [Chania multitudinisentens RB-25]
MLNISCDDGSTFVKLAWMEQGEIMTHLSGNSFKEGWSPAILGAVRVFNYTVDGKKYSHDLGSTAAIGTTHVSYQYSTANLLAIHHTLLTSGLSPQEIILTVTLPVTEFFDADNQPNEMNIEAKKKNVLREITLNKGEVFKIKAVNVMPESLPAALSAIIADDVKPLERSLIIDLGGTTLDCGIIQGAFDSITQIKGNAEIGTSRMTRAVMNALITASTPSSYYVAGEIIRNCSDNAYLKTLINDVEQIENIQSIIKMESASLADSVKNEIESFNGMQRIYLTGGGAEIIYPYIREHFSHHKVCKINEPQLALVKAMVKA